MSGYELAERLRRDPANQGVLLVAVTGWGQDGDRERAYRSGFDAHLTKPPAPEAIRTLLERGRPAGHANVVPQAPAGAARANHDSGV
jgi:CheY-like chemotaxis protein